MIGMKLRVARIQSINNTVAICLMGEGSKPIAQDTTSKISTSQIVIL